jgi:hypothetical protein
MNTVSDLIYVKNNQDDQDLIDYLDKSESFYNSKKTMSDNKNASEKK